MINLTYAFKNYFVYIIICFSFSVYIPISNPRDSFSVYIPISNPRDSFSVYIPISNPRDSFIADRLYAQIQ